MKPEETKKLMASANELSESYADVAELVKGTTEQTWTAKRLWRGNSKPVLIKVGLALIAFPDPTISDVVGGLLVAAGTVQAGIQRQALHMEDVPKTFQKVLKEIRDTRTSF